MKIKFPYEVEQSRIFGAIRRPIARVSFWSRKFERFLEVALIVDTGADYTIFPHSMAADLGIDVKRDCRVFRTFGVGGSEKVFLLSGVKMKLGSVEKMVPVGFLSRDDIPPLLGRYKCIDSFAVLFSSFNTTFSA